MDFGGFGSLKRKQDTFSEHDWYLHYIPCPTSSCHFWVAGISLREPWCGRLRFAWWMAKLATQQCGLVHRCLTFPHRTLPTTNYHCLRDSSHRFLDKSCQKSTKLTTLLHCQLPVAPPPGRISGCCSAVHAAHRCPERCREWDVPWYTWGIWLGASGWNMILHYYTCLDQMAIPLAEE